MPRRRRPLIALATRTLTHPHPLILCRGIRLLTLCIILPLPVRSSPPSSPSIHLRGSPLAYIQTQPTCTLTQLAAGCTPGQSDATLHTALSPCLAVRCRGGLAGQARCSAAPAELRALAAGEIIWLRGAWPAAVERRFLPLAPHLAIPPAAHLLPAWRRSARTPSPSRPLRCPPMPALRAPPATLRP
jgi:hypothetical protein